MQKQCRFLIASCFLGLTAQPLAAQTSGVLIDPAGDGGFETGTSFSANGWSVANTTNANRIWYVGTGQAGYSGARAAFIGNSTTNVGTSAAARTVHLYRSVTFPANITNIQLSFKYKQATVDFSAPSTYYDYIAVYTAAATPSSGSLPSSSGLRFGPYPSVSVPSFTTQTVTLPDTLAGKTTNLVFTFVSDGSSPNGYGAVDDILLSYGCSSGTPTPGTVTSTSPSVCAGSTAMLSLSGATTSNGLTYQWKKAASSTGPFTAVATGGTGASYTTGALTQTTYYTADITCSGATATTPVYTATVVPLPAVSVSPATATACAGSTQLFTAATSAGSPAFVWKRGSTTLSGATAASYTASTAGTYTVTVTDGSTGCSTTSAAATLTVQSPPTLSVSPSAASLTCGAAPILLSASSNYYASVTQLGAETFNNGPGTFTAGVLPSHTTGAFLLYPSGYTYAAGPVTFTTSDATGFVLVNSDTLGSGQVQRVLLTSPAYSTTGHSIVGVVLNHYYEAWTNDSAVQVQASVDGINWTVEADLLPLSSEWQNGAFNTDTFFLSDAYCNKPIVYIRLLYATSYGYYYGVNDFKLLGLTAPAFTWTPAQGLYTDAGATTPYTTGTAAAKVYARPNSTTSYFAAASIGNCSGSAGRSVAVTDPAGMVLASATTTNQTLHTNTGTTNTISIRNDSCQLVAAVKPVTGNPVRGFVRSKVFVEPAVPTVNGTPYLQRHYEITPDTGAATATGTVTLYATQAEFTAYNDYVTANNLSLPLLPSGGSDNGNVRITKKSGTSTTGAPGAYLPGISALINPTSVTWDATNSWWAITFPVTGFSGFFIHTSSTGVPLPLAALSLTATVQGPTVALRWTVASDAAAESYTAERSSDGRAFEALATVSAAGRNGYQALDEHPLPGRNFYRIRATDRQGAFTYSPVATAVLPGTPADATVFPNPAAQSCTVFLNGLDAAATRLYLTDAAGRILRDIQAPAARTELSLADLPPGLYLIRCTSGDFSKTIKLTKQ